MTGPQQRDRSDQNTARSPVLHTGPCEGPAAPSNPAKSRTLKYAEPLTETIAFRCSASEKARLEAEACRARRPLAELLRERLPLVRSGHRKVVPEADPDLLVALSRIGANLNQMARALNAARKLEVYDRLDTLAIAASLVAIERQLDGLREDGRS